MPGRDSRLKSIQTRKQLLLLETEIHRAQLREDWEDVKSSFHHVGEKFSMARSLLGFGSLLAAGFSGVNRIRGERGSVFSNLLLGALVPIAQFMFRPKSK